MGFSAPSVMCAAFFPTNFISFPHLQFPMTLHLSWEWGVELIGSDFSIPFMFKKGGFLTDVHPQIPASGLRHPSPSSHST
jgi:hypothetical protein